MLTEQLGEKELEKLINLFIYYPLTMKINNGFLKSTFQTFAQRGIQCYYVGGYVRDLYLGIDSDDIDICLVGVTDYKVVTEVLSACADKIAPAVGEQFPVWIAQYGDQKIDFALARKEMKDGHTRQDFLIDTQDVTIEQDLMRRDLTVNAIAINCLTQEVIDPFNGVKDLQDRNARPVSEAFADDPLRVYRAARFCARFDLFATPDLIEMVKRCDHIISKERIGDKKLIKQVQTLLGAVSSLYLFINPKREDLAVVKRSLWTNDVSEKELFEFLTTVNNDFDVKGWMLAYGYIWSDIQVEPIVTGKKLIEVGQKQGPIIGKIIKYCLSLQDQGVLNEQNWEHFVNQKF